MEEDWKKWVYCPRMRMRKEKEEENMIFMGIKPVTVKPPNNISNPSSKTPMSL